MISDKSLAEKCRTYLHAGGGISPSRSTSGFRLLRWSQRTFGIKSLYSATLLGQRVQQFQIFVVGPQKLSWHTSSSFEKQTRAQRQAVLDLSSNKFMQKRTPSSPTHLSDSSPAHPARSKRSCALSNAPFGERQSSTPANGALATLGISHASQTSSLHLH